MKNSAFWLLTALLGCVSSGWFASVTQQTKGPCSPKVTNVGRDTTIVIRCSGLDPNSLKSLMNLSGELPKLTENFERFRREVLALLAQKALDIKQVQETIALNHRVIFAQTEGDAKRWARELLESSSEKEKEIKSLASAGRELADKLLLRWNPVYEFFLKEIDSRISELKRAGKIRDFDQSRDIDLVVVDSQSHVRAIRSARFVGPGDGALISLFLIPAQIHRGNVRNLPGLRLQGNVNGAIYYPIYMHFTQEGVSFDYTRENQKPTRTFRATGEDPLADEEFRRALSTAIGNSISFVYLNGVVSQ